MIGNLGILTLLLLIAQIVARHSDSDSGSNSKEDTKSRRPTPKKSRRCNDFNDQTAPLTIDAGTDLQDLGVTVDPIAKCTSCRAGTKNFYPETDKTVPSDVIGSAQLSGQVACPNRQNLCICNSNGICCNSGAIAPELVMFIPFNGAQEVVVLGSEGASISCTNGKSYTMEETTTDAPLGSAVYFKASAVSCNGCANIRKNKCQLPIIPV